MNLAVAAPEAGEVSGNEQRSACEALRCLEETPEQARCLSCYWGWIRPMGSGVTLAQILELDLGD